MIELEKFLDEPVTELKEGNKAWILINKIIYPPSPYKYLTSGKDVDWEKLGFILVETEEGKKLKRDGRIYYSPLMEELEEWFKKHNINFDFYPPSSSDIGSVVIGNKTFMSIEGDIKPDLFKEEPWASLDFNILVMD